MNIGNQHFKRAAHVILHSIYPPSILHWMRVLGRDNVLIVPSEKLRISIDGVKNQQLEAELNKVYRFLGLCPFSRTPTQSVHETIVDIPIQYQLNDTMRGKLEEFFSPFSKILSFLVDPNAAWEARDKDAEIEPVSEELSLHEFVPTFEWQPLPPHQSIPSGIETRLPLGEGGTREARIPNPFRLQLALPDPPCKYFLRVDLLRSDFVQMIKEMASKQCKRLISSACLQLVDKATGAELVDQNDVETSRLFHKTLELKMRSSC